MTAVPGPWIVRPVRKPDARLRLVCFPPAGGGVATYRPWAQRLPPEIELCAVEPPGRGARLRETPSASLAVLVDGAADAVAAAVEPPYAFFGHSMGALLAFEVARRLPPEHVFVSGHRAPSLPMRRPPIYALGDAELCAHLARYNGTPHALLDEPDVMRLLLPAIRADLTAAETYAYAGGGAELACPLWALGGDADEVVAYDDLTAWSAHTIGAFAQRTFAGDHFSLFRADAGVAETLAAALQPLLGRRGHADVVG
jgi:medium-chain acyl-[acyl-carrier-protein] hydrolase